MKFGREVQHYSYSRVYVKSGINELLTEIQAEGLRRLEAFNLSYFISDFTFIIKVGEHTQNEKLCMDLISLQLKKKNIKVYRIIDVGTSKYKKLFSFLTAASKGFSYSFSELIGMFEGNEAEYGLK